jgi:hypothetical protein
MTAGCLSGSNTCTVRTCCSLRLARLLYETATSGCWSPRVFSPIAMALIHNFSASTSLPCGWREERSRKQQARSNGCHELHTPALGWSGCATRGRTDLCLIESGDVVHQRGHFGAGLPLDLLEDGERLLVNFDGLVQLALCSGGALRSGIVRNIPGKRGRVKRFLGRCHELHTPASGWSQSGVPPWSRGWASPHHTYEPAPQKPARGC